jgi:hypothetical protein
MKKTILIITTIALIIFPILVNAAGTISYTVVPSDRVVNSHIKTIEISWVADAADGSIPSIEITDYEITKLGYFCLKAVTDPGATAPTADYDIACSDSYGDIFDGELADRSATVTEQVNDILIPIIEPFTCAFTNNSVNSATGKLILIFAISGYRY